LFPRVLEDLARFGVVRVHRNHAVNPAFVREIRHAHGTGWEIRLEPPVSRVLPVSRRSMRALLQAYGASER
jgi:DNA-binding LytR/AlgR family response regulator